MNATPLATIESIADDAAVIAWPGKLSFPIRIARLDGYSQDFLVLPFGISEIATGTRLDHEGPGA
jgi:hypothetical protein